MRSLRPLLAIVILVVSFPAMAGTYSRALSASFGTAHTGLAANMTYRVIDASGSTLIAATGTGITESPTGSGIYKVAATWNQSWAAAYIDWIDSTDGLYATTTALPIAATDSSGAVTFNNTTITTAGSVTGNVGGNVTGSVGSVASGVTVSTVNDKTGYALATTPPSAAAIASATAAAILTTPSNLIATDNTGKIGVNNFPSTVTVGGYASGQDPAALVWAKTVYGTSTLALLDQIWLTTNGPVSIAYAGSSQTSTFKQPDGTTTGYTSVLTTNQSGKAVSRSGTAVALP